MANEVSKVRFVRCPKCRLLLTESAEIPVYQCGGCRTVLRAKNAIVERKSDSSVTVESISSQNNPLQHESEKVEQNSIDVSTSSCKEIPFSCSNGSAMIEMDRATNKIAVLNEDPPHEKFQDHNYHKKGGSSENLENSNKEVLLDFNSARPRVELASGERNTEFSAQHQPDQSAQDTTMHSLEEQVDGSMVLEQHGFDSLRSRHEAEESTDRCIDHSVALVEDSIRSSSTAKTSDDNSCEDLVPNKYRLLSKRTFRSQKTFESISSKELKRGEVALVNGKIGMNSEAKFEERILSSKLFNNRIASALMGSFHLNREEPTSKDGIYASQDSEDFHSVQNWMELELEKDVPSRSLSRDSHFDKDSPSNFHNGGPMSKFRYLDHDRKQLLQKVDELRDQITKTYGQRGEGNRRRPKNKSTNESEQKTQFPSRSPRPGKTEPPQPYQFSQLPVSGQSNFSCLHCNQKDWQVSIKFPPTICCHKGLASLKQVCKEKPQITKKKLHYRPVARGAPFVICHNCLQLLHLPADFIISRRKYHKLHCGECSEVLMFSLLSDGAHIIPHSYAEMQHPPSEVGSSMDAPISHDDMYLQGDPVSYSEEYELSFSKSHSSVGEPVLHVSRNSPETEVERGDGDEYKLASTLHRLMGYSSPSEIINQPGDEDEEYQSTEVVMGHVHRTEENSVVEGLTGVGTSSLYQEISSGGTSPYYAEMRKVDESLRRYKYTRGGPPLHGFMEKGIEGLNHGLNSMNLKV